MRRMYQIGVPIRIRMKSQEKAMSQALLQSLRTTIRSPLISFDQVDLRRQLTKGILNLFHLRLRHIRLKTEHNNMAKNFLRLLITRIAYH